MRKKLLIIAWEYEGYHSQRGTALARRITQVAESFQLNGWDVTAIHCDHREESGQEPFKRTVEPSGVTRVAVKLGTTLEHFDRSAVLRKMETLYYVAFKGDRSAKWADNVIKNYHRFGITGKPDYIIAFYTPRVPLLLGNYFSRKLGVPWIADIQDPIMGGISRSSVVISRRWVRSVLHSAASVVHISPEWAATDGAVMGRHVATIRHAIPMRTIAQPSTDNLLKDYKDSFNIFYGGSLSSNIQSLELLKKVLDDAKQKGIKAHIFLAGNTFAYDLFRKQLGEDYLTHLGWLSRDQMDQYILSCDCTLVIPWSKERVGIPSKFYELCIYPKPIWIIGGDLGAFDTLLAEWQHPALPISDFEKQKNVLSNAVTGDFSGMFGLGRCAGSCLTAKDIYVPYSKLMK